MNEPFEVCNYPFKFRVRKMNAIELFAVRSQLEFDNYAHSLNTFNLILENIEVSCGDRDQWLACKDEETYYPDGLENNIQAIDTIVDHFMKEFKAVFRKSSASKG